MLIIGLTGGIGSGKSTVSAYLKQKGYKVSDADLIAHQITKPGEKVLDELIKAFGSEIIDEQKRLKRKYLASIVFSDEKKEKILNEITHRGIQEKLREEIRKYKEAGEAMMFLEAPLLFEAGIDSWCDYVWLVTADIKERIKRVIARDGDSEEEIKKRIACQMSDEEKIPLADDLIDNSVDEDKLTDRIEELLEKYENKISG